MAKSSVRDLDIGHYTSFTTALSRILSTDRAENTYAQILDGLPTGEVRPYYGPWQEEVVQHTRLCDGSLEAARKFRDGFRPGDVQLDSKALHAYQDSPFGSRAFKLRLIEVLVIACHDVAVRLFQESAGGFHKECYDMTQEPNHIYWTGSSVISPCDRPPTAFFHGSYVQHRQYPNGVADVVGYWAEDRIFGGVVVFDRGENDEGCTEAYIHPSGGRRLISKLSDFHLDEIHALGLPSTTEEDGSPLCPLPFVVERYMKRVDPWDALESLHIFRNRYERNLPARRIHHCVRPLEDHPEIEDDRDKIFKLLGIGPYAPSQK